MLESVVSRTFAKRGNKGHGASGYSGGYMRIHESYIRTDVQLPPILHEEDALVLIPTASTLDAHLDTLLACGPLASRAIILGSVVARLKSQGFGRTLQKLRQCVALSSDRTWLGFPDENFKTIEAPRNTTNALRFMSNFTSCMVVVLSENDNFRAQLCEVVPTLIVMKTIDFVREYCSPNRGKIPSEMFQHVLNVAESAEQARLRIDRTISSRQSKAKFEHIGPLKRGKLKSLGPNLAFVGDDAIIPSSSLRNRAIHGDLVEIAPIQMNDSLSGDSSSSVASTDESTVFSTKRKQRQPYEVVSIIKRDERRRHLVVTLDVKEAEILNSESHNKDTLRKLLCVPMDDRFPKVRIPTRLGHALLGKRFVVAITDWPEDSFWPDGKYIQTIGTAFELSTESSAILVETELDDHERPFSSTILAELPSKETFEISPEAGKALDFRDRRVMSIDPIGCLDIDDAISFERIGDGSYELAVHIADVTRFVQPGSSLDREAYARATSVYLQERRLDMLPRLLCEDLCSLRPGLDRYALSAVFKVNDEFTVDLDSVRFVRTVIRSRYALAYEQAQRLVDGFQPGEFINQGWTGRSVNESDHDWMRETIGWMMTVARKREAERKQRGAVSLEAEGEYKFALNAEMKPTRVEGSHHMEIHDTIAELMILANEAAAKMTFKRHPTRALLRHHPPADESRFQQCIDMAASFGVKFDASSNAAVGASLKLVRGRCDPAAVKIIESLATRAMSEAQYVCSGTARREEHHSPSLFYHFGLALDFYTHFTSPIRRYADVIVARLLLEEETIPKATGHEEELSSSSIAVDKQIEAKELLSYKATETIDWGIAAGGEAEEEDLSWANALGNAEQEEEEEIYVDPFATKKSSEKKQPSSSSSKFENDFGDLLSWVAPTSSSLTTTSTTTNQTSSSIALRSREETDNNDDEDEKAKLNRLWGVTPHSAEMNQDHAPGSLGAPHLTTQGVQDACDHINRRHRSAKEASSRSQALFFALFFSEDGLHSQMPLSAVVLSIQTDGIICFAPEYDLRVAIRLLDSEKRVQKDVFEFDGQVDYKISIIQDEVVRIHSSSMTKEWKKMSPLRIKVSCRLIQSSESFPEPRLAPVQGRIILDDNNLDVFSNLSKKKADLKRAVIQQTMTTTTTRTMTSVGVVAADDEKLPTKGVQKKSLYAVSTGLLPDKSTFSVVDAEVGKRPSTTTTRHPSNVQHVVHRLCFGGFVRRQHKYGSAKTSTKWQTEEEEEILLQPSNRSASSMTNAQMKKLETMATLRIAKLQAEKYDSRVKRRMKKGN